MEITVKNYRGCAEATLTIDPIALVSGTNHSGKSSIAQAVAAALTRNPAIVDGVTKAGAEVLLRDGEKRGRCTVGDESGSVSANWPGASVSEDGTGPQASEIACGLVSLVGMKPKDAAATLISAMDALPALEDLRTACPGVRPQMLDAVWSRIQSDGWDASAKRASERSASLKGAWEQVTGEKWGSQKGATWEVTGHDASLNWTQAVADAEDAVEKAVANQAANEAEVQRLRDHVAKLPQFQQDLREAEAEEESIRRQIDALLAEADGLPQPQAAQQLAECPHCKGHLVVISRTEVRVPESGLSDEENQQRADFVAAKRAAIDAMRGKLSGAIDNRARFQMQLRQAQQAQQQLDAAPTGTVTAEQVQVARDALAAARAGKQAEQRTLQAATRHAEIVENNELVAALAPNGVRQTVLASKMAALRARLAEMSAAAGWPVVEIDDELRATLGGRIYGLLSESEKFRVRTVLQVALADLDGSDVVIVDAADILDKAGRNGLFGMLRKAGMRALVCMTMNEVKDVPNLAKAGLGRSYWIGGATLAPVE